MIKFRLYYDKDALTDWLNEMSEKGWAMESFFMGFFSFEKCAEGQYLYQVDFNSKCGTGREYRELMREAGIAHYSKIRMLFKIVAIIEFICMCV